MGRGRPGAAHARAHDGEGRIDYSSIIAYLRRSLDIMKQYPALVRDLGFPVCGTEDGNGTESERHTHENKT